MELIKNNKIKELSIQATKKFFEEINQKTTETFIALSPGSSTYSFLETIIEHCDKLPQQKWDLLKFCLADEREVQITSNDSNYKQLKETFFNFLIAKGKIKESQIIKYDLTEKNPLISYNVKVRKIDIAILGVGPDGHTASLFPGHESINDLRNEYIKITNSPKSPSNRITMTRTMIKNSTVFIFFISESKRKAYQNFLDENIGENKCPAKITKKAKQLYVITNLE
ncbi:MAG: 6-phosphogluconolactonase [Candidatus Woesearchaeota archaeon]